MIKERILLILCDPKSSLLTSVFTPVFTPLKRNILFSVTNLCLSGWESLTAALEPHSNTRQSRVAKGHFKKNQLPISQLIPSELSFMWWFPGNNCSHTKGWRRWDAAKAKGSYEPFLACDSFLTLQIFSEPREVFFFLSRIGFWPDIWIYADLIWTGFIAMNVKEHSLRWSFRIMIMII